MTPLAAHRMLRLAAGQSIPCLRDERGSSLVEFALSSTILFLLVVGILTTCFALYTYNIVSEAAREATRFAVVRGSACHFATACPATSGDIQTYVRTLGLPGSPTLVATPAWSAYPAGRTCKSPGCNGPGDQVTVTVTDQFTLLIPFLPRRTLNMSSTAAMVISQ